MQYVGARYVPKFMGTYDNTQAYENMCVVDNGMGTSYISKVPVPANTPLTDTDYWAIYGASSGAIINLQNQIGDLDDLHTTDKDSLVDAINELKDVPEFFFVITPYMSSNDIKSAVATHNNIYIAPGTYEYAPTAEYDALIIARSNMNIWIDGELSLRPNAFETGSVISVDQCSHVRIFGSGKLIGDKLTHTGATGEWQHGINITNSNDVTVEGLTIEKAWGDGVYIGGYSSSSDIIVKDIISNNNRRNAISVVSASDVLVKDSIFSNTSGTAPEAGIAIETNGADGVLSNIRIVGCYSYGNAGSAAYASSHVDSSVYFEDCNLDASGTTNYAIAVTSLDANAVNKFNITNSILTGVYDIALGLNVNSKLVATDNIYQGANYSVARATAATLNDLTITGVVKDATISEGFITAIGATITNSYFDFKCVNSSVTDVRRFSQMDNDTCTMNVDIASEYEFVAQSSELWSNPTNIYSDNSYTAGMTQADLRYSILRGIKYKIINRATSANLTVLLPSGTLKTNTFSGTLAAGHALIVERIDSNTVIVTDCS